jgi:hypothetical protein
MDQVHEVRWNTQLEKVLSNEAERCLCYSVLHRQAESRYATLNNYIALPCIVLSTVAGASSVGSSALFGDAQVASVAIGGVSIFVGILNTIGSYFSWARRSESHKSSSVQYGKLHRFLMIELSLPRSSRMNAKDLLKTMRDQIDRLFETSPAIPDPVVKTFKKQYEDNPDISRPEIANGLDPVKVYDAKEDDTATPAFPPKPEIKIEFAPPPVVLTSPKR